MFIAWCCLDALSEGVNLRIIGEIREISHRHWHADNMFRLFSTRALAHTHTRLWFREQIAKGFFCCFESRKMIRRGWVCDGGEWCLSVLGRGAWCDLPCNAALPQEHRAASACACARKNGITPFPCPLVCYTHVGYAANHLQPNTAQCVGHITAVETPLWRKGSILYDFSAVVSGLGRRYYTISDLADEIIDRRWAVNGLIVHQWGCFIEQ